MASNFLKVNRNDYEAQIIMLQGYLGQLDAKVTDYESLRNDMTRFIDGNDDTYEKLRESVENNIKVVRKAREMCDNSIKMLKETLDSFEQFGQEASNLLDNAIQTGASAANAAIEAMHLMN